MRLRHWILSVSILGSSLGGWARAASADRWVTFHHDYQRTGRTGIVGPQTLDTLKWRMQVAPPGMDSGVVNSSPAIGINGEIYVSAYQQGVGAITTYLSSFNPDGILRWHYSLGAGQTFSSPSLADDDTLYIGAGSGGIACLRPDGNVFWTSVGLPPVLASPTLYHLTLPDQSDKLVVGAGTHGADGVFYALDAINHGNQIWTTQNLTGSIDSSAAVGSDGSLYFGSQGNGGSLNAVNPATGEAKWPAVQTTGAVDGAPALAADGTLYFGTFLGVVYAVNSKDGAVTWQWPPADQDGVGAFISSPAIGADGTIYIGNEMDNSLYAFTPGGRLKWKFDTGSAGDGIIGGGVFSSPAVGGDGTVYFGCENGVVYALNPDGTLKSKYVTNPGKSANFIDSSPAIGPDGTLYIGSSDGYLYAFQARSVLPGDLNQDGRITVVDAQIALRMVVDPTLITPTLLKIGDVFPGRRPDGTYGDGKITIADVIRILQRAVGVLKELPQPLS